MRICFVAHFTGAQNAGDIGTKSVAQSLVAELTNRHEVSKLDIKHLSAWKGALASEPDIFHFVLAPTTSGFVASKLFSLLSRRAKVVVSAPNPTLACQRLIAFLQPDLLLVQSLESEHLFKRLGFQTHFLPNGTDLRRFVPSSDAASEALKEVYLGDKDKFVILHVGPIIRKRNLDALIGLDLEHVQLLVVGRHGSDRRLCARLKQRGAHIITRYIDKIEEVYALSDCYVFPTPPLNRGASIETPLSVLEAMACNKPIITTKFGALPRLFGEGAGFFFVDTQSEIQTVVKRIQEGSISDVATRQMVSSLSWGRIAMELEHVYAELLR